MALRAYPARTETGGDSSRICFTILEWESVPFPNSTRPILEPVFEADFLDCSYSFRTGRSARQALEEIRGHVEPAPEKDERTTSPSGIPRAYTVRSNALATPQPATVPPSARSAMGATFGAVGDHPSIGNRECPRRALSGEQAAGNQRLRFDEGRGVAVRAAATSPTLPARKRSR